MVNLGVVHRTSFLYAVHRNHGRVGYSVLPPPAALDGAGLPQDCLRRTMVSIFGRKGPANGPSCRSDGYS